MPDACGGTTYVQIIQQGGFFAVCTRCGSDIFTDRMTLAEAEAEARAHGPLNHNYPYNVLQEHEGITKGEADGADDQ